MSRSKAMLLIPFLLLALSARTALAQAPVNQPLTLQSVPQMLQQTGCQVETKVDNQGTFWHVRTQNGPIVVVEPKVQGTSITCLTVHCGLPMPKGGVNEQQISAINAKLTATHKMVLLPQTPQFPAELRVVTYCNYSDSNPQEMRFWVDGVIAKANLAHQMLSGSMPAPSAPAVSGAPVGQLAGTTWVGTETLAGFGKLTFQFAPGGKAVMIDAQSTVNGTYTVNGNQIVINLPGVATYRGAINGTAITGQGTADQGTWNFTVSKQ
jgi:hypothetical protein